jgi:branched-chain amino acid transport system permease protein
MNEFLATYQPVFDQILIASGFAFSQYIALRAGVFSLATAGFASLGAYGSAILSMRCGFPISVSILLATVIGIIMGGLLSVPLARLRGVFQAIATLAFVQIVVSLTLYSQSLTGGALGINGIPAVITTWHLLVFFVLLTGFVMIINQYSVGRAFDAIRQDETVAVSLGISVIKYQALAFAISGGIGALSGGMLAFNTYSLSPEQFGFPLLVATIAAVILGGRISVAGPIVGAALLCVLPELARPLAGQRLLVNGVIVIAIITYMPLGIVDTLNRYRSRRRALLISRNASLEASRD